MSRYRFPQVKLLSSLTLLGREMSPSTMRCLGNTYGQAATRVPLVVVSWNVQAPGLS